MDKEIPLSQRRAKSIRKALLFVSVLIAIIIIQILVSRSLQSTTVSRSDILTSKVRRGDMEGSFSAEAVVTPVSRYQIQATTSGKIESILKQAGDFVQAGETIIVLGNDDLQLNLLAQETAVTEQINNLNNARILNNQSKQSQRLKLAEAQSSLKRIRRDFQSKSDLYARGFIPEEEFLLSQEEHDLARIRYDYMLEEARTDSLYREQQLVQLEQSVAQIRLSLNQIRSRIGELKVKAPVGGQITELDLNLGQIISTGAQIATIEDVSRYYLNARVDQFYLPRIKPGGSARIRQGQQECLLSIHKVHPRLQNDKVVLDIGGELPPELKSGQNLKVDIISESLDSVLYLPQGQYLVDGAGTWVFVVDGSGKRAERRQVKFGFRSLREVEVVEGLAEDEEVIISSYKDWLKKRFIKIK